MKFKIEEAREIYPQILGESNKEYKEGVLKNYLDKLIETISNIKDFNSFNVTYETDFKKKKGKVIIEFKLN